MEMISKKVFCFVGIIFLLILNNSTAFGQYGANITLLVFDESGTPVEDAKVKVGFELADNTQAFVGLTDMSGQFEASSETNGHVNYVVEKYGYYKSIGAYEFYEKSGTSWIPSDAVVEVVLRKIEAPIPMYARNTGATKLEIPMLNQDLGFDLIEYDWVSPYGKGKKADFIFTLYRKYKNRSDYEATLKLKFSNRFDGIQSIYENRRNGSELKLLLIIIKKK